jgi:tripartite ATP-independent transporter DctM subunit
MDRDIIGIIGCGVVVILLIIRTPIGVALGLVSFFGIWALTTFKAAWGIITAIPYSFISNWNLSAVPMFLAMGYIAHSAGLTKGLFTSMRILMGRVPGGLASSTVIASALFASCSGSSVATAAAFSRIAVPEMLKAHYDQGLATGSVAASGTLGSLIPPSVLMILYAIFMDTSIAHMFIAGVIPGILSALIYIGMITVRVKLNNQLAPKETTKFTKEERRAALMDIWPLPVLIVSVLGGIMFGLFSPTEAGAIGASVTVAIAALRRNLKWKILVQALLDTARSTSAIYIIVIGAAMYSRFMGFSRLPNSLSVALLNITENPFVLIAIIGFIFIILGMFVEAISLMLLTLPIFLPVLRELDINLIWFGIIVIKLLEIGLITPPVGINVYVIKSALGPQVHLPSVFLGTFWFLGMDILTLSILIVFPFLSLWLPAFVQ